MNGRTQAQADEIERALRRAGGAKGARPSGAASSAPLRAGVEAAAAAARVRTRIAAEGLADVSYGTIDSPLGSLLAAVTERGLVRLAFPEEDVDAVLEGLAARISPRIVEAGQPLEGVRRELEEYFGAHRRDFGLSLDWALVGPFARRVLRATARIPYGSVLSYGGVARAAGSPRGSRAAGNALGANPIPIVIPCHRVLRTGGALGGYGGGLERKRWLLTLEGALQTRR